jgi:uncharacterized protein
MLDRLPVLIDPLSFAERGKRLLGKIKINELSRLSDILLDSSGEIEIDFSFDKEGRFPVIVGEIKANLIAECQSCLKQVVLPVDKHFKLGMVLSDEQADRLAGDCEPLFLQDEKISLNELVEDELLLALPDFPKHPEVCIEREEIVTASNDEQQQMDSNNPFSVLAKLKNTGD